MFGAIDTNMKIMVIIIIFMVCVIILMIILNDELSEKSYDDLFELLNNLNSYHSKVNQISREKIAEEVYFQVFDCK